MKKIGQLKEKLIFLAVYIGIVATFRHFGILCLFRHFLGITCPGCGMTRAVLAALRFDFAAAFAYHPMFWSMPLLGAYFLFDGSLFGNKKWDRIVIILLGIGFLAQWLVKIVEI